MRPQLILFDCDGVLVDSEPAAARTLALALEEQGLGLSADEVDRRFRGRSLRDCVVAIEAELGRALPGDFIERLNLATYAEFQRGLKSIPYVEAAIQAGISAGIPMAVASSGSPEKMKFTLGLTGLLPYFEDRLYSAKFVERGKPAPDLFLHAAAALGCAPSDTLVVEDSLPGVRGGISAEMAVWGYAAHDTGEELAAAGARVFHDMRELASFLEGAAE